MVQWIIIIASFAACSTLWHIKFSKRESPYLKLAAQVLIMPLWILVAYVFLILAVPEFEHYVYSSSKAQQVSVYNDTEQSATFKVMARVRKPKINDNLATFSWRAVYPTMSEVDYFDWNAVWQYASHFRPELEAAPHSKVTYQFNINNSGYDRMGVFMAENGTSRALAFSSPDLPVEIYISDLLPLNKSVKKGLSFEFRYFAAFFIMLICTLYYLIAAKGKWWLRLIAYLSYLLVIVISGFYSYLFGRILLNHYFNI